ncbi:MAG TPA: 50S ribosomal protein L11 methyltransferase [Vitreimonas sp.]|uniref:50S ribosomal protein L11 methyltransferase n=1 Tax=Vitreimonas sp. TaxID=3069702 RepID=UPI002D539375|nr:50S ribosomal protein L11 methyltransferase [Vitreimonas sp.]HYD89390.1 50S ribosomal protein L11 methyltransferase [Vitreimonas sp.]
MLVLTALGTLTQVRAAADELDRHDPSPADAVSWFEETPGKFRIEIYVPTKQDAASAEAIVGAAAPELHLKQKKVKAADWVAMSLEGLPAVRAGRFVVAGAHALMGENNGRTKVWIEASEAFGTGHHGTTWGCLMALEGVLRQRKVKRVLDVGAGSGVLAIAAAKHGAEALAIEIDPRAAAIAEINARQNKVAQRMQVIAGDGARHIAGKQFDLVFANILMRPLIKLAPRLAPAVAPGGALILSGLLRSQAPLVREAYASRGLLLERQIPKEAWMTLVWRKAE